MTEPQVRITIQAIGEGDGKVVFNHDITVGRRYLTDAEFDELVSVIAAATMPPFPAEPDNGPGIDHTRLFGGPTQ